jgi:hypothetical protein
VVAAAVIGAGVLTAGATVAAGSAAASATQSATNAAVGEQQQALQQQAELSAPYRALGTAAIPQLEALLGLGPGGAGGIQQALAATPGYQFTKQQGDLGIANLASTQGGISGNTLAALDTFNTGLADKTYQSAIGDILQPVQLGQAAAAGQAANVGSAASNIGSALINQGQTTAAIDANTIAGITKAFGSTTDALTTQQLIAALNNPGGG